MKTIQLTPQSLKPLKPKQQLNFMRSRIRTNNIRNIEVDSINRISDIVNNRKFRDSGHIFYLKFNDKERSKTIPTKPKHQGNQYEARSKKYADISATLGWSDENPEDDMFSPHEINNPSPSKPNLQNMQPQSEKLSKIKNLQLVDQQANIKTLYFYKKQSLNPQLQLFKLYQQYQKPKLENQNNFQNQLIGTQKTFYHKIRPISLTKRSISVNNKQKFMENKDFTQNTNKIKKLSQIKEIKEIGDRFKLQPLFLGKARQVIENTKRKIEPFQPWSYAIEDHESYRL